MADIKVHNPNNLPLVKISELKPLQGELKKLPTKNRDKLAANIKKRGFVYPIFAWKTEEQLVILDGHQRQKVMLEEGWDIEVPVVIIEAENERDAAAQILEISSQYGEATQQGYQEFINRFQLSSIEVENVEIKGISINQEEASTNNSSSSNSQPITCPECNFQFNPN